VRRASFGTDTCWGDVIRVENDLTRGRFRDDKASVSRRSIHSPDAKRPAAQGWEGSGSVSLGDRHRVVTLTLSPTSDDLVSNR
jgi:hypothetical protein